MLRDRVLFTGTSLVSHPVLDRLFGGKLEVSDNAKLRDIGGHLLLVVDARLGTSDLGRDGVARKALLEGVPVLILSPNEGQLDELTDIIGAAPSSPSQAVFIAPNGNRSEPTRFEASILGYPPEPGELRTLKRDTQREGEDPSHRRKGGCGCAERKAATPGDTAMAKFITRIESRLTRPYSPAPLEMPAGLEYIQTTWNPSTSFSTGDCDEDRCFDNGQGSIAFSFTVWGFLSQTASSNTQYLVIEATYNVNPGSLAGDDDETRGWVNTREKSSVTPTSGGFALVDHIPNNGTDSWSDSFTLKIGYKSGVDGSYQIYDFNANVTQSIDSWSVQNVSQQSRGGSQWYVNSPLNGSNVDDSWTDAFTTWGHVEEFPSASTGTITLKEVSAWQTSQLQTGAFTVSATLTYELCVFWASSCGLLICYAGEAMIKPRSWAQNFTVNFSSINP